jgi:methylglyoxal synthase
LESQTRAQVFPDTGSVDRCSHGSCQWEKRLVDLNEEQECARNYPDHSTMGTSLMQSEIHQGVDVKQNKITIERHKKVALLARGDKEHDLVEWAKCNKIRLSHHTLYATDTTGALLEQELGFPIHKLESGSRGRDQQIGAKIVDGEIDFLIFFWDPITPTSHDSHIKALLRTAVMCNIPVACNPATADFMISSPLMNEAYGRLLPKYREYRNRTTIEVVSD